MKRLSLENYLTNNDHRPKLLNHHPSPSSPLSSWFSSTVILIITIIIIAVFSQNVLGFRQNVHNELSNTNGHLSSTNITVDHNNSSNSKLKIQSYSLFENKNKNNKTIESPVKYKKSAMSPNLKQFSELNVDLVFEDSVDVGTSHYNDSYDYYEDDTDDRMGTVIVPMDSSSIESRVDGLSAVSPPKTSIVHRPTTNVMMKQNLNSNNNKVNYINFLVNTDHLQQGSKNDNLMNTNNKMNSNKYSQLIHRSFRVLPSKNEIDIRSVNEKRNYHQRMNINGKRNKDPNAFNHSSDLVSPISNYSNSNSVVINNKSYSDTYSDSRTFINPIRRYEPVNNRLDDIQMKQCPTHEAEAHDHILRPFIRKSSLSSLNIGNQPQKQSGSKYRLPIRPNNNNKKFDNNFQWSFPLIELKRLTRTETTTRNHSSSPKVFTTVINELNDQKHFFNKRLPLLSSNDEGFILTKANVSDHNVDVIENNAITRRDDSFMNNNNNNNNKDFKHRFGEMQPPPPSPFENRPSRNFNFNNNNQPPFKLNHGLMEDVSINDLELDDEFQPSRLNNNNKNNNGNGNNIYAKNKQVPMSANPVFMNQGFDRLPPGLHQMMPLFFDKFMSQLSNVSPPKQFIADQPINNIDNDISDLDAPMNPMERRLVNGPPKQSPMFSNEIIPSGNEFDANFGNWPKIFRFTDGRINLHDFEREKKRSRIKFSHKMGKSHALFNIKRDSFLILHGGTFNQ